MLAAVLCLSVRESTALLSWGMLASDCALEIGDLTGPVSTQLANSLDKFDFDLDLNLAIAPACAVVIVHASTIAIVRSPR